MRDIKLCHPRMQIKAAQWLEQCEKQKIFIKIGETLRTVQEQDDLYAQGRTRPGPIVTNAAGRSYSSQHQWGIALDFYLDMDINGNGKKADDAFNDSTNMFEKAAAIAKTLGLAWGGDWSSLTDKPHLYLSDWGSTPSKLKEQYHTPEKFMKSWEQPSGWVKNGIGWWYRRQDGSFSRNNWEQIDGEWYYFNDDNYMKIDWIKWKDKWYYCDTNTGMMLKGLQIIGGKIYYFHDAGDMAEKGEAVTLVPEEDGSIH